MRGMLLASHGVFRRGRTQGTALDIRAHVGTSLSPTATGNRAVTGVGFQPKAVMPFWSQLASGVATNASLSFGSSDGIVQAATAIGSATGLTTSSTHRRHTSAGILTQVFNNTNTIEASLSSLDADGFTLNWNPNIAISYALNHICLGGADLEVSLTQHQMNATNAPQSFAHGLSGAPTGVMVFGITSGLTPPTTTTSNVLSIGAWAGSSQWGSGIVSANGVTTTATNRTFYTDGCYNAFSVGPTAVIRKMAVASVDATNVNCTYPVTANASQILFWMLAIRGARCQVGTFNCNFSTSPLTINTPGITPRLFLTVLGNNFANGANTVQDHLQLTIGASDGTRNVSCGITDENGLTTTNARRHQNSSAIQEFGLGGDSRFVATAAFSGESVVLSPTVYTTPAVGQGGFLVVGS